MIRAMTIAQSIAVISVMPLLCCRSSSAIDGNDLELGMQRMHFQERTSGAEFHQFSASVEGDVYRCYSFDFGQWFDTQYYFVFRNDLLESIVRSDRFFEWETIGRSERQVPWIAEERMINILDASSFTIDEFRSDLQKGSDEYAKKKRGRSISNVWPLLPILYVDSVRTGSKKKKWRARFDSELIEPSMSASDANKIYGDPVFVISSEESEIRAYGPVESLEKLRGETRLYGNKDCWVAVKIEEGYITRVFSHELFNDRVLVKDEYMMIR